ncbi:unnamed protein product [Linum trigynum]|uniref:Uncharacterized protein n=1 Tax=Linum trigynum TaxID=586398 RepID=A0AAV2F8W7_9ROSI
MEKQDLIYCRCKVQEKLLLTMIDEDIKHNFVSAYVVSKIGLSIERYPSPYWWQNPQEELPYLVTLTYSICYDVLPLQSVHMVLGQPWTDERQVAVTGAGPKA